ISRLVFGTVEPKFGAVESRFKLLQDNGFNHKVEVEKGVLEKECAEILKNFFRERRLDITKVRSSESGVRRMK
ncbi:MAG: tRNA-specific adenosine deaminase, partial [Deltaproteobacteria bacterium]|nr:tRNA-specific adenosine deaminase [Deltaproteobacteria bacterium]